MNRDVWAEAIGSFFLFCTVIGSGIMAERLAGGNMAVALLGNTAATGAMLFVLITMLGPLSGAHFNPAVTLVVRLRGDLSTSAALRLIAGQLAGGIPGVWAAHLMFAEPILQLSGKVRTGPGQWTSEFIASFGLVFVILGTIRHRPQAVPASVALYIVAAYWFTSSTSFANPAITLARTLSDTFAGIAPSDAPAFIAAQLAGALAAAVAGGAIFAPEEPAQ
ncbi:MIP/aquaporin family protein [Novosphingobium sp. PASSN1]|uniref:aquaporin n=1 Tax=Novosphingobium sp. PASSN1 TaxID=2015561 RepID=UPI000BD05735|nr:MIP/aquaporin family protein [Novosphingobium sp. PASSN1]OYU34478.1 MAG: aquaporin family protein [Novosphingobium sp. PASSN1]